MPAKRREPDTGAAEVTPRRKVAKGPAAAAIDPAAARRPLVQPHDTCINASLQQELAKCDDDILLCPTFSNIRELEPTPQSGVPAYSEAEFALAMTAGRDYVASCPLHWILLGYELQPNVPKSKTRILNLKDRFCKTPPRTFPDGVTVALEPGQLPHAHN